MEQNPFRTVSHRLPGARQRRRTPGLIHTLIAEWTRGAEHADTHIHLSAAISGWNDI